MAEISVGSNSAIHTVRRCSRSTELRARDIRLSWTTSHSAMPVCDLFAWTDRVTDSVVFDVGIG